MGSGMGIVLEGLLQHRRGRAGGQQAGWASRGRDQARTAGVSRGARGPTASSQMPIARDARCACSPLSVICLHGTRLDENSLALCPWYTIVLWTVGNRFSFWTRHAPLGQEPVLR